MTAKPPNLSETMAAIRRAILDRDDAIRRTRLRRQAGKHIANTALEAVIRTAIEDYAEAETNRASLAEAETKIARDTHGRTLGTVDRLSHDLADMTKLAEHRLTLVESMREQLADMQGQLAIAADHLCEPLPQRTRQANASIREGLDAAGAPMPAAPATPAKTRNGTGSRPGRSHRAATTKTRTSGGVDNPKPGESLTEPPA